MLRRAVARFAGLCLAALGFYVLKLPWAPCVPLRAQYLKRSTQWLRNACPVQVRHASQHAHALAL
eukprot:11330117-Alexandrium_andersonii.AAC.1